MELTYDNATPPRAASTTRDARTGMSRTATIGPDELEALFERHEGPVWRFALRMTGEPEAARDLVQETFLRALGRRLPAHPRQAESWLMQTVVNLARDRYRRRKVRRERRDDVRALGRQSDDPEGAAVARATLERVIAQLPPRRRAVLVMRELDGYSVREIAQRLGLVQATVRWHLAAARRDLARALAVPGGRGATATADEETTR